MNCADFQRVLPYIIESGGNADEEEHLRTCKVCSDLVADLRYIAEQAKLLVPMEDPDPKVWDGIQKSLEREGLIKGNKHARSATPLKISVKMTSVGIILLLALFLVIRQRSSSRVATQAPEPVTSAAAR